MDITHITRSIGHTGRCSICEAMIFDSNYCYLAGTGLDDLGNSFVTTEDYDDPILFCGIGCVDTSYIEFA
jgi:hypothetical protein